MRVLIVNPRIYVYGGAELLITKLANYMTRKGIENALLTTSILPEVEKDLDGTKIIVREKPKMPLDILSIGEIIALHKGIRDNLNNYDVINVHNYPAELSIFPYRKPVVWMCNEPVAYLLYEFSSSLLSRLENRTRLTFDKLVIKRYVRNVVVADEFNAGRLEKIYGITPTIINYGIDHAFFSQGDGKRAKQRFNLYDNFTVIQVGAITPFKNQLESIKAIGKLRDKIPDIKLLLVGLWEGEYIETLQRYVHTRSLEKYVIFTGHLSRDEVRDLYHACDIALFPIKSQGGWLSPFEALCANLPIIVSTSMTASNIIEKEGLGIVTDNFTDAVISIYGNPEKYRRMAKESSAWVDRNLTWDNFCQKMINTFEGVI